MALYFALAILSLAFLIVVHEGGHYFVARWCGMRIERFSIGFGPGIVKRKSPKTGTTFQLAPIPFGGFVEIRGMNIAEEVDPEDRAAYPNRPAWQRFITIFAGPATNYLSAIVLALALFTCHGVRSEWRWFGVAQVKDGYDAMGKLEVGDRILAVDHKPILAEGEYRRADGTTLVADPLNDSLVARINAKHGDPVTITVLRDGHELDVTIHPKLAAVKFGNAQVPILQPAPPRECVSRGAMEWFYLSPDTTPKTLQCDQHARTFYMLGIAPSEQPDFLDVGVLGAAKAAIEYPVLQTKLIAGGLYDIIRSKEKADPGGPKRIFDEFTKAWQVGWVSGVELLMMLSVYLGLFNLFPLPALDGGRLVFLAYEMVTRRRANPKIEAMVHMAGIMVLGVVMILVTMRDCHAFGWGT